MPTPGQLKRSNGSAWDVLHPETTWASVLDKPTTFTPTSHSHGNISNAGAIGSTPGLMVKTGASGVLAALAAGSAGQYLQHDGTWSTPPYPVTLSGYETLSNKTLTSPVISATSPTAAGSVGYDSTNKFLMTGDGSVSKPIPTAFAERLSSDVTRNTTTFTSTNLSVTLEAGYTYRITFLGKWFPVSDGTNGIKFGIIFGGTATISGELWGAISNATVATELRAPFVTSSATSGTGNSITLTGGTTGNGQACGATAIIAVTVGGVLTVQTANESAASGVTLMAGATLVIEKILTTAV